MEMIPLYDLPGAQLSELGFKLYHLKDKAYQQSRLSSIPLDTNIPHRHNFYEICIFVYGGGIHEIDFCSYPVEPCSIHFVSPGQVHLLGGSHKNNGYVMAFTPEFFTDGIVSPGWLMELPFFNPLLSSHIIKLGQQDFNYFLGLIDHIEADLAAMRNNAQDLIRYYLKIFLLKCSFHARRSKTNIVRSENTTGKLVHKFRNLIEQNFTRLHQVQQYSDRLHVSSAYLNKCCKQVLGKTSSEMIMDRILLESKRLLLFTDASSKEIAYQLQFDDPAYFSRIFKKKTGYAPSAFRVAMHEKYKSYS